MENCAVREIIKAQDMAIYGYSLHDIAKATGLSEATINEIFQILSEANSYTPIEDVHTRTEPHITF